MIRAMRLTLGLLVLLAACGGGSDSPQSQPSSGPAAQPTPSAPAAPDVQHLDAAGAAALLARDKGITILDVRTPAEFAAGHLEGAVNLDIRASDFNDKLRALERGKPYLVHCQSGGRSSNAVAQMRKLEFTSIYHLDGGIGAWKEAGKPVVQ
jgi:rhodanese-related sulfurtransferase